KLLVMDVDGTLTNGKIYIGMSGELIKAFNVKDGQGIYDLNKTQVIPVVITGRQSDITINRCKELGIKEVHQGVSNKLERLLDLTKKYMCGMENVAYIGDDISDLECILKCRYSGCPSDAVD